jgi:hypothetical protein
MLTFTGIHVTKEFGAPSLRDIAVGTMRIFRFCGAGAKCYPVGLHLMLVADLLPDHLKHHGLLHDAPECVVNDVPRPMKTAEAKALEAIILRRIYNSIGLALPTKKEAVLIHEADMRAVNVEGRNGYGPRGYEETQPGIDWDDFEASILFHEYQETFDPGQALNPDSFWPLELEKRLRRAIAAVHANPGIYTRPA